jgi:hypothetical protein
MAIAIQAQPIKQSKFYGLGKSICLRIALLYGLAWHVHAYLIIFGITLLTVLSLIGLYFHNQLRKLRLKLQKRSSHLVIPAPLQSRLEVKQISRSDRCC